VPEQQLLDLAGVDVVAAGDDQLPAAPLDAQVAALVEAAQVAGAEPAVGVEGLGDGLRVAPVAAEHVGAAQQHLSLLAAGKAQLDPGRGSPTVPGRRSPSQGLETFMIVSVMP
jgi:hypothetical protein